MLSIHTKCKCYLLTLPKQGEFWSMHRELFLKKPADASQVISIAGKLSLDTNRFRTCLDEDTEPTRIIDRDLQVAKDLGLGITPAFAIGILNSEGRLIVHSLIKGARPIEVFRKAIDAEN